MNKKHNRIETRSKVAIAGGGPAGCFFFALYLLQYASEQGIHPEITIYQQRDFNELGPKGCKGCAGILSISLLRNLGELGLTIPDEIIQGKIDHYAVHSPYTSTNISNPEKGLQIVSIYRGGGPRISNYEYPVSFDGWLLGQAQKRGVKVENQAVSRIYLEKEVKVEVAGKQLEYDLIVLASGINAKSPAILGLDYVPPKAQIMAQDELYAGIDQVKSKPGNVAHTFLIPHSGLIFGTIVPKKQFINASVLSLGKHPVSITDFLNYDIVRSLLPDHYEHACGCRPKAVVGPAHNYYADRFIVVGDAAVSRLYKDGIGSSLLTVREAARTTIYHRVARQDFKTQYQPFCKSMDLDNRWGQLLFTVNNHAKDSHIFLLAQHRLIGDEQERGLSPYTVQGKVRALKAFASWLFNENYTTDHVLYNLKMPKAPQNLIEPLTPAEIDQLVKIQNPLTALGCRNIAILVLFLDTGLRVSELCGLRADDAHIEQGYLKVMGKGSKERVVPIGGLGQKVFWRYVFHFRPEPINELNNYLFLTIDGKKLEPNAIKLLLKRWGKKAGVPRLHAHLCRHTYATDFLIYNCGDVFRLQQILGHTTLEMVRKYVHYASAHTLINGNVTSPVDRMGIKGLRSYKIDKALRNNGW